MIATADEHVLEEKTVGMLALMPAEEPSIGGSAGTVVHAGNMTDDVGAAANAEIKGILQSVTHAFRSPLWAVESFSKSLLEDCREHLGDEQREDFRHILCAAEHMNLLVAELSRLSAVSKQNLLRSQVSLSALATAVAQEMSRNAGSRNVTFAIAQDVLVNGDAQRLRSVLQALFLYSWVSTKDRPDARIEFGMEDRWTCFVRDNGVGFTASEAGVLFSPCRTPHSNQEGLRDTDPSLALARRLIFMHGGRLCAESVPGKGTTFRFTLGEPGLYGLTVLPAHPGHDDIEERNWRVRA